MHYRDSFSNRDPALVMGNMLCSSLRREHLTQGLGDILPCRFEDITLPVLGAALFEQGWLEPSRFTIRPGTNTIALEDIGYVTETGQFVAVDNVRHSLQATSGTLSWGESLEFYSSGEDLGDTLSETITTQPGKYYYRRR